MHSKIYFGGGCFWCTEAVFQRIKGVEKVVSGYMGGRIKNPTYREICTGNTGHAEVIAIDFDPKEIALEQLLLIFFETHDPTTLNRQGNDVGTQYRSVIFYTEEAHKNTIEEVIQTLTEKKIFHAPIVTEIAPAPIFYPAEDYHQNYYAENENQPYCSLVIQPKLEKIKHVSF